jgi:predicted nucleic acid-binding protein
VILVDSSIWIAADRRPDSIEARELVSLLARYEVATTDVVIAEVLQGAPTELKLHQLIDTMSGLHFFHAEAASWLRAGELSFQLRRRGLTTALSDLIIAQVALDNELPVYAIDSDFERVPGLQLHKAGM